MQNPNDLSIYSMQQQQKQIYSWLWTWVFWFCHTFWCTIFNWMQILFKVSTTLVGQCWYPKQSRISESNNHWTSRIFSIQWSQRVFLRPVQQNTLILLSECHTLLQTFTLPNTFIRQTNLLWRRILASHSTNHTSDVEKKKIYGNIKEKTDVYEALRPQDVL